MEDLKSQIIDKFSNEINSLDLSLDDTALTFKYNSIVENILTTLLVKKEKLNVPLHETSNNNDFVSSFENTFGLCSGKSADTLISSNTKQQITKNNNSSKNESTTIPSNFTLSYDMKQFAQSKFIQNIEEVFEDFTLYYQSKSTINSDWEAVWKRWVLNQNKYKKHLVKTTIDENLTLNNTLLQISKKYMRKDDITLEFTKFKNHYMANGDLKVSWEKVWENWCINHKQFKPKTPKEQSVKQKEKADYKWDFRKAKEVSDRIKNWLRFDKKINWLDDYYWKDIPIPGIGWQKVMHPDFNKEEILLFKIDSSDGNFMLQHKTNDIIDAEVLEND